MQTLEEKELILKYLGFYYSEQHEHWFIQHPFEGTPIRLPRLQRYEVVKQWHYDNWLMPIVEHIEKGDFGFKMCRKRVEVYIDSTKETIISVKEGSRLDSLYRALVDFAKMQLQISNADSLHRKE